MRQIYSDQRVIDGEAGYKGFESLMMARKEQRDMIASPDRSDIAGSIAAG